MAGCDADLMQVGDDIARRIEARNGGLLAVVNVEVAEIGATRAERGREIGAHVAAERRIEHVEPAALAALQNRRDPLLSDL